MKALTAAPEAYVIYNDAHRDEYIDIYTRMAKAVRACQQPEGYWTRSLLDPAHAPGPETSGTAFFTYGLLWGINNGYLDKKEYLSCVLRAWDYLTKVALQPDGILGYVQPIGERAILFGAGHCALALAPLLQTVGFRVTVFDDRSDLLTDDRFPSADALICGDFTKIGDSVTVGEDDYIVVMTSGHSHDFEVQEQVLRHPLAYIGVIGSRAKTASVNARLREAGVAEDAIAAIHTPVGTAIKAVTPEEIAVSIAGEMIYERAVRREKAGYKPHSCPMH